MIVEARAVARFYALLSQINKSIFRTRDPAELSEAICRVAVEYGGFLLAWIGRLDEASGAVRLNGPVELQSDVRIDSSDDGAPQGAEILFTLNTSIDSEAGEYNDLTLRAGTDGAVSFNKDIGVKTDGALGQLIVTDARQVIVGGDDSPLDGDDLARFKPCLSGASNPHDGSPTCTRSNLDGDSDVDQSDFGLLQRCLSGPYVPANPNCAG